MELFFKGEMTYKTNNTKQKKHPLQLHQYICQFQVWYAAIYLQDRPLALASIYYSS